MLHKIWFLLFPVLLTADNNLIDWSESRKLTWNDFKASPNPASTDAALTSSGINAEFGYDQNGLKHSITCRFDKNKSWVRVKNDYILNHEQGHFDLSESFAREFHKDLLDYKFNKKTVGDDLNKIYQHIVQKLTETQEAYDNQSNHSLDTAKQRQWDILINSRLKEFEDYKNYH